MVQKYLLPQPVSLVSEWVVWGLVFCWFSEGDCSDGVSQETMAAADILTTIWLLRKAASSTCHLHSAFLSPSDFYFFLFFFPPISFQFYPVSLWPRPCMAHLPVTASPVTCFPFGTAGPKSVVSLFPPSLNHGSTWITCRSCVTGTDLRLVHSWLTLSRNTELDGFRMFCSSLLSFILSLVAGN